VEDFFLKDQKPAFKLSESSSHALNTGERIINYDSLYGQLHIPDGSGGSVRLEPDEVKQVLVWLYDNHRATILNFKDPHDELPQEMKDKPF